MKWTIFANDDELMTRDWYLSYLLRPMEIKDDWVKVKTIDGKYTGWIEIEWLCGNSLTNCC